tara:strand:- start:928 stop:1518 length:591 start_codon:yes stop_codon:yes gene_type:complete
MKVEYGNIKCDINGWINPSKKIFDKWKNEFLKLEEAKYFDIYLGGSFVNVYKDNTLLISPEAFMMSKIQKPKDVDIILIGEEDLNKIENLVTKGTRLAFEKYNMLIDIKYYSNKEMVEYSLNELFNLNKEIKSDTYLLSDRFIIDGDVKSGWKNLKKINKNLWKNEECIFPTENQYRKMSSGFPYQNLIPLNMGDL